LHAVSVAKVDILMVFHFRCSNARHFEARFVLCCSELLFDLKNRETNGMCARLIQSWL